MIRWAIGAGSASLVAASLVLAQPAPDQRRSSYHDMGPSLQRMQDDETANPGMLFVMSGATLWGKPVGAADKSCATCHAADAMAGVAARYPAVPPGRDRPVDLEGRINLCRTANQGAEALAAESADMLALTAFVAHQSNGRPIAPPDDPRLIPFRAQGETIFKARQGQLNLSCANCHDDNAGRKLASATIPQGHPDGYPIYRLEWQTLGSLKRRLRNCLVGMRAEPYARDSDEYLALEIYLMDRAKGMTFQTPGVRP
jgi:L-cysteine S-thiosulfotransferase